MRINLNSPDGNIFMIFGKLYNVLRENYTEQEAKEWLDSVISETYEQTLYNIQEKWKKLENVEKLEFYKSPDYEMRKEELCI